MDRGRFERLEEAAGKAERDHILLPQTRAVSGGEAQPVGFGQGPAVEAGEQKLQRGILVHVSRGIDVAVADAVLERDAPLPTGGAGRGAGQRLVVAAEFTGDSDGAVAGQPSGPVHERHPERLAEQKRAETGAVEKQLALDLGAVVERDRGEKAGLGMLADLGDAPLDPRDALLLGPSAKEEGVARGVELEGVGQPRQRRIGLIRPRPGHPAALAGHGRDRKRVELGHIAQGAPAQPEVLEFDPEHVDAVGAEGMHVGMSRAQPIDEFDPQLVGRMGLAHEFGFVDPEQAVELDDLRNSCFAHADGADGLALD